MTLNTQFVKKDINKKIGWRQHKPFSLCRRPACQNLSNTVKMSKATAWALLVCQMNNFATFYCILFLPSNSPHISFCDYFSSAMTVESLCILPTTSQYHPSLSLYPFLLYHLCNFIKFNYEMTSECSKNQPNLTNVTEKIF